MRTLNVRKIISTIFVASVLVLNIPAKALAEGPLSTSTTAETPTITQQARAENTGNIDQNGSDYKQDETGHWNNGVWTYDPKTEVYQPTTQPSTTVVDPNTKDTVKNDVDIVNNLDSTATSGNAAVTNNTLAGDAKTGDATATTTLMNTVNSTFTSADNQKVATFVKDVTGDVNGDLILQPLLLKAMLESGNNESKDYANIINDTTITNNLNLSATSGNASVTSNTQAGNATTGSANTVANVVNIINSMISAKQSFVGTINIYGNLNGDILIAPDFIPQLLESNGSVQPVGTASITSNDTQSIVNNVSLAAESGKAAVLSNTVGGNATTGNADTNVVIFNLSGHEIIASNSLLVFVNVLGKWVGVIVDAPEGATSAVIGDGVKNTSINPDLVLNATNNGQITNNITLQSRSGDALVSNNTVAGNATSGNATASANIANITNNTIGLSGWFGVLFINVFGNWFGSFGIDTPNGNPIQKPVDLTRPVEFVPKANNSNVKASVINRSNDGGYEAQDVAAGQGLAQVPKVRVDKQYQDSNNDDQIKLEKEQNSNSSPFNVGGIMAGVASIGAVSFAGIRRIRRNH